MTRVRSLGRRLSGAAAFVALGCGGTRPGPAAVSPKAEGALSVFAEGPCPRLSVEAAGTRRFIVYGDHGRDAGGWVPGERVAAAATFAELRDGRVFRRPHLLSGLPTDARGYILGELRLGGTESELWLTRTTARYSVVKRGPLFERATDGHRFEGGWQATDEPVTIPAAARGLPELPSDACGASLRFVPITSTSTPRGGLIVAGRCDDDHPANLQRSTLVVAHGAPGATRWEVRTLPATEVLDGIINVSVYAASDDEVYVSAYEPYQARGKRRAYLARFDGHVWRDLPLHLADGIMSVAGDGRGTLWLAAGRALYRLRGLQAERVSLPPLRFSRTEPSALHIHDVRFLDGELWVQASYRVRLPTLRGSHWASVLFSSVAPSTALYCDVTEPAEAALSEVTP